MRLLFCEMKKIFWCRNLYCLVGIDNKWEGNYMVMMWFDFYKVGNCIFNYLMLMVLFGFFINKL